MTIQAPVIEQSTLIKLIGNLTPEHQERVYDFILSLTEEEVDTTEYLMSSKAMQKWLDDAIKSIDRIPFEVVREKLGI